MKSICTTSLILFVCLGWSASPANAQSGYGSPSLLPLPSVVPANSSTVPATYYSPTQTAPSTYAYGAGSVYAPQAQALPQPQAQQAPGTILTPPGEDRTAFGDELASSCCGESLCCEPACGHWFGAVAGLVMTRNRANPYWTTYETNNNVNQLMNTQNAKADWVGGGQITVGYGFGGVGAGCGGCGECGGYNPCGCYGPGIAFTYWGLGQMNGYAELTDPNNNLSTPINLQTQTGDVMIGSNPASYYFDNSPDQRIWRNDRVNNFELNFIQGPILTGGRLTVVGLAGFRYFRFDERLTYGSVAFGHSFGDNGGADEAYLSFRTTNNLFGAQVGALLNYSITQRFGAFFVPKVGVFGNQMNSHTTLLSGNGLQGFDIYGHKSDVSLLGELDAGLNYALLPNLWVFGGYRVVGVTNLALADNQFLPYLADTAGFAQVKQSGSLILHGALFGIAYLY